MSDFNTHKEIGYELMMMLSESFESSRLQEYNHDGLYQEVVFNNDFYIQFTRWRNGTMPFYFIFFNDQNQFILELDLSMLIENGDCFSWNLKVPSNELNNNIFNQLFGEKESFNQDYIELVKEQKRILNSGINTPRNGYSFLNDVSWEILCENLCALVRSILEAHSRVNIEYNYLPQAEDDDITLFQNVNTRLRRGQRLFRTNLIELYQGRCAISGWSPTEALEAVHIVNHAETGINHTDNGIILRADLHRLFDSNLLRIDPESLCVELSSDLRETEYWRLNDRRIKRRKDGTDPSREYLKQKWETSIKT